jgi:hypothetical protein
MSAETFICDACNTEVAEDAVKCPNCGASLVPTVEEQMLKELVTIRKGVTAMVWCFIIIPITIPVVSYLFSLFVGHAK